MAAEKKKNFKMTAENADIHTLYEAAVQCPEANLAFVQSVFEDTRQREPRLLREDFCGTANLACEWAAQDPDHESWGVDLDLDTLKWGETHHLSRIGEAADRVHLIHDDVMTAEAPAVDVTVAFNFSYWIFKQRRDLVAYFRQVCNGLNDAGMLVVDIFGGTRATLEGEEKQYVLPKSGKYLLLILQAGSGHGRLWTTLRSRWGGGRDKLDYYKMNIGEIAECVVVE